MVGIGLIVTIRAVLVKITPYIHCFYRERRNLRGPAAVNGTEPKLATAYIAQRWNCLRERGFLETTVEDITEAADVGKGTFFNYFPTKEHILAEFGGERVAAVQRAVEKARTTKGPVLDVVRELAGDAAGQSDKSAALLRAIFAAHASCSSVREELIERAQIARRLLSEIYLLAQERGEIRR